MLLLASLLATNASAAPKKLVIAVLYFDNNTDHEEYDVLQKGLADMMVTDLSSIDGLEVVEREKLQKLVSELKLQKTRYFDPKTAQRLGRGIGASYAVTGAISAVDPEIRLDLRLIEISTAKIVLADKVVGAKDHFFDLQEALVEKFQEGLQLQQSGKWSTTNRIKNVSTLLAYSKAVDSADRGDYQDASAQLTALVKRAPEFHLARLRLDEIEKRLDEAHRKRAGILSGLSNELLQDIDAHLADKDPATLAVSDAGAYFAYRGLRGDYILASTSKYMHPKAPIRAEFGETTVKAADQQTMNGLMHAYYENGTKMIAELKAFREANSSKELLRLSYKLEDADRAKSEQVGIRLRIMPRSVAEEEIAIARFLLLGGPMRGLTPIRPTLAQQDHGLADKAVALLDDALVDIEASDPKNKERSIIEAQMAAGEGLVSVGRTEEGVARWQAILDRYSTSTEYATVEKLIRDEVDAEKADQEDAAFFKSGPCDMSAVSTAAGSFQRIMRRHGYAGAAASVDQFDAHCSKHVDATTAEAMFMVLAGMANVVGDCDGIAAIRKRVAKPGSQYVSIVDSYLRGCGK